MSRRGREYDALLASLRSASVGADLQLAEKIFAAARVVDATNALRSVIESARLQGFKVHELAAACNAARLQILNEGNSDNYEDNILDVMDELGEYDE